MTFLYSSQLVPVLKPGHLVAVHPLSKFGVYRVPEDAIIELLPARTINLATPYTKSVPAYTGGAETPLSTDEITDLDMDKNVLAHYKFGVIDNVEVEVYQGAGAVANFVTKKQVLRINNANTAAAIHNGSYFQLPEFYVFEDTVRPTFKVYNNSRVPTYWARIVVVGFSYTVEKIGNTIPAGQPILHMRASRTR